MLAPVVVVTGASAGLGRATALEFAKQGMKLCLIARDWNRLEQLKEEIQEMGGSAEFYCADVSNATQIETIAEKIERSYGPIEIWINNASVTIYSLVKNLTAEEYKRVTEVGYLGYVNGTLAALKRMMPRDRGVIIQIGSALNYQGVPFQSAASATKHAIRGFSESLITELKHDQSHVRVIQILLPSLNTPSFEWSRSRLENSPKPIGPVYQPEVAAEEIVKIALRPSRSEVLLGYSTIFAVLLERLFPKLRQKLFERFGYQIQQTDRSKNLKQSDNLWESVSGDFESHGTFESQSKSQAGLAFNSRRLKIYLGLGLVALSGAIIKSKARQESKAA